MSAAEAPGVRVIRDRDLVRTPWKNGGGRTAEIAACPAGAGFEDFDWRLSMADVAADGPFSRFPGIDRTLVLLAGDGLVLTVDGVDHRLGVPGAALSFSGDADTSGRLTGAAVRDLNVMIRRGRFAHDVRRVGAGPAQMSGTGLILAHMGPLEARVGTAAHRLDRFDALLCERPMPVHLDREALLVSLQPLTP